MPKEMTWHKFPPNLCSSNHRFAGATGTEEPDVSPLLPLPQLNMVDEHGPCKDEPGNKESQNNRLVWDEKYRKHDLIPLLSWAGTLSTRPGCTKPSTALP